jgi:predicted helicase
LLEWSASFFPMLIREDQGHHGYSVPHANLTAAAQQHLKQLKAEPTDLFFHALATLHAPAYRDENQDALRQDWPRVPLPEAKALLESSAALGRRLSTLLDVEQAVDLKAFKTIGNLAVSQSPVDPARHFIVRAGWGIRGKGGICMPGKGRREGERVYLNDEAWWEGIPESVWEYSLGGYQVLKKWLSYREEALLARPLTLDEVEHFKGMARRIAAILDLGPQLDQNYTQFKR